MADPPVPPGGTAEEIDALVSNWRKKAGHGAVDPWRAGKDTESAYRTGALRRNVMKSG
jgi:hypothetical protein